MAWLAVGMTTIGVIALHWGAYLNHDVAWFAWASGRMIGGAVLGRDLVEPNFPLAYLIYFPASSLGSVFGVSASVKAWVAALIAVSGAMAMLRLDPKLRLPVLTAFGLFLFLVFPGELGQREQIAFLLVLPYCIPAANGRRFSILVGAMAGIGFAIKPHFLIALAVIEIGRKPFRTEQLALIVTLALYGATILLFFRPFLFEMLPVTRDVYSAFNRSGNLYDVIAATLLAAVIIAASFVFEDRTARALGAAAIGFILAAYAQQRLYDYQLLPAWGFIALGAAVVMRHRERMARLGTVMVVAALTARFGPDYIDWLTDANLRRSRSSQLVQLLDRHDSFIVLAVHPYPAFPTALHTDAEYLGVSNSHWFLPAVGRSAGQNSVARENAVRQAVRELSRRPEIVIVDIQWRRHTDVDSSWSGFGFLLDDPEVRRLWEPYSSHGYVGPFDVYVRSDFQRRESETRE